MDNNVNKDGSTRFPQEIPAADKKNFDHGVIENVVKSEIEPTPSQNPATPYNTDAINTEFAKARLQRNQTE